jgi:hypothetical protein
MPPNKYHHVRSAVLDPERSHECHWPDCHVQVPAAKWGCKDHWLALPKAIRDRIWNAYTLGQEDAHELVSQAYLDAASAAQSWIRSYLAAANARVVHRS